MDRTVQPWHQLPGAVVESPSLEGFNKCLWSTWGHDLGLALAMLGEQLELTIFKAFSNLKDSMILFYDSKHRQPKPAAVGASIPQEHG